MSIFDEITAERAHQELRFGHDVDDTKNTPWMWVAYIAQQSTRWMAGTFLPLEAERVAAFRIAMIKAATVCIAAVESLDRQRAANGKAFFE